MSSRRKSLVTAAGQVWKKRVLNDKLTRASLAANPLPPSTAAADSDSDTETKYDNEIDRLYAKAVRRATNPKTTTTTTTTAVAPSSSAVTSSTSSTTTSSSSSTVAIAPAKAKKPRLPTSDDVKGRRRGLHPKRFANNKPENVAEEERDIPTDHQLQKEKLAEARQPKKKKTKQ